MRSLILAFMILPILANCQMGMMLSASEESSYQYYVAGYLNGKIYIFDEGELATGPVDSIELLPIINGGPGGQVHFGDRCRIRDLARDPNNGKFYVVDVGFGDKVYRFNNALTAYDEFEINVTNEEGFPESIEIDNNGDVYIGGRDSDYVWKYSGTTGALIDSFDVSSQLTAPASFVTGIRLVDGNFYISDGFLDAVHVYDSSFTFLNISYPTDFNDGQPQGTNIYGFDEHPDGGFIAVDETGNVFIFYDEDWDNPGPVIPQDVDGDVTGILVVF